MFWKPFSSRQSRRKDIFQEKGSHWAIAQAMKLPPCVVDSSSAGLGPGGEKGSKPCSTMKFTELWDKHTLSVLSTSQDCCNNYSPILSLQHTRILWGPLVWQPLHQYVCSAPNGVRARKPHATSNVAQSRHQQGSASRVWGQGWDCSHISNPYLASIHPSKFLRAMPAKEFA